MREKTVHFITGLRRDFGGKPFIFAHLLAILSARWVYSDHRIFVYHEHEPSGVLWDVAKRHVTPVRITAPTEVFGRPIAHFAHAADVVRLTLLLEHGGIYFDLDSIVLRAIDDLPTDRVVMGAESESDAGVAGLCNAFIAAPRGSPFLRLWLDSYRDFDATGWNRHSVQVPYQLARQHPGLIHVEPRHSFFYPHYDEDSLRDIFERCVDVSESYSIHLWEALSWSYLTALGPEAVAGRATTYNLRARQVMDAFPGEMAALRAGATPAAEASEDAAYAAFLEAFMEWNGIRSVVDLGCGDWRAMRRVQWGGITYLGIDAPDAVARNAVAFGSTTVRFEAFAGMDRLPGAELFLCREVHHHWSNALVEAMLRHIGGRYRYALITAAEEPLPQQNREPSDAGPRPVDIRRPPFNRRAVTLRSWYADVGLRVRKSTVLLLDP